MSSILKGKNVTTKEFLPEKKTKEEVEKRVMGRFPILDQNKEAFHNYFCSYDFHENEKDMVDFWADVLIFYYESIFQTFVLPVGDILDYSKFKQKRPIGLPNILLQLRKENLYFTDCDIKGDIFYQRKFPKLYPSKISWSSYLTLGLSKIASYAYSFISYGEEEKPLEANALYFNNRLFEMHTQKLLDYLSEIIQENDIDVIAKDEFELSVKKESGIPNATLQLNLCLMYLSKIKKIALFTIKLANNKEIECIKYLKNEMDKVNLKDQAILSITMQLKEIEKSINKIDMQIINFQNKTKECLRKKDKEGAKFYFNKTKNYIKIKNNYLNMQTALDSNLMQLKNMDSNANVRKILMETVDVEKKLGLNVEEWDEIASELQNQKEKFEDIQEVIKGFSSDDNQEELEQEMEGLINKMKEESLDFPEVLNEKEKEKEKGKENMINDDNLNEMIKNLEG